MHHESIMETSCGVVVVETWSICPAGFNHQVAPSASLTTYGDDREERVSRERRDDDEREMTK
jgi:hypothetical protein